MKTSAFVSGSENGGRYIVGALNTMHYSGLTDATRLFPDCRAFMGAFKLLVTA